MATHVRLYLRVQCVRVMGLLHVHFDSLSPFDRERCESWIIVLFQKAVSIMYGRSCGICKSGVIVCQFVHACGADQYNLLCMRDKPIPCIVRVIQSISARRKRCAVVRLSRSSCRVVAKWFDGVTASGRTRASCTS